MVSISLDAIPDEVLGVSFEDRSMAVYLSIHVVKKILAAVHAEKAEVVINKPKGEAFYRFVHDGDVHEIEIASRHDIESLMKNLNVTYRDLLDHGSNSAAGVT